MSTQMLQRRDTSANWALANPVLKDGEIGVDTTTKTFRIGNGFNTWSSLKLSYIPPSLITSKGDLLVGSAPAQLSRLPRGTTGQKLTVQADGSLAWVTIPTIANYETVAHASSVYETIANSNAVHAAKITTAAMSSTYETIAQCASAHATLESFAHAASTYETITHADSTYEKIWNTVVKQTASTVSNSVTLISDPELQFPVAANGVYIFEMYVSYLATVAGQMRLTISGPTGSTNSWGLHAPTTALTSGATQGATWHQSTGGSPTAAFLGVGGAGASMPLFMTIRGIVRVGATAGVAALQFAQVIATADTGAVIKPASVLRSYKYS